MNKGILPDARRYAATFALFCAVLLFASVTTTLADAGKTANNAGAQPGPLTTAQIQAFTQSLIGKWTTNVGNRTIQLQFNENGTYRLDESRGKFQIKPGKLILTGQGLVPHEYDIDLTKGQLTLKGPDIAGSLVFTKRTELSSAVGSWFTFSPRSVGGKLWHILIILIIVFVARLIILFAQWISYLAVFSDKGLFLLLYRKRKNRARTIHLLVLNLIKYIIYFSALGLILAEVGVNTTAYLASLSVFGLAIGFGSQGLVQDMVTGFFVLFEGQYDVDDMVDLSGQTGVVTEIGLRMTRLRNYLGQTIVIPNRNIAVVGNYFKGAQAVSVDLALAPPKPVEVEPASDDATANPPAEPRLLTEEDFERARQVMYEVATEIRAEFVGIVLEEPTVEVVGNEKSGRYLRLELSIWPGQAWLVDNQLIPRLREALTSAGLTLRGDRITAFYHARLPAEEIRTWRWAGLKNSV